MDKTLYKTLCAVRDCDWIDCFDLVSRTGLTVPDIATLLNEGLLVQANSKYRLSIKGRMLLSEYEENQRDLWMNRRFSIASLFIATTSLFVSLVSLIVQVFTIAAGG